MRIEGIDHLVITTSDLGACLHFYVDVLGMELDSSHSRYAVRFGSQKFNIHTKKAEFLPAAERHTYGSLDLCLVVSGDLDEAKHEVEGKGWPVELGPVERYGARGPMRSIYLRDPDGNLVELCSYTEGQYVNR